jgi:hypothetical protein
MRKWIFTLLAVSAIALGQTSSNAQSTVNFSAAPGERAVMDSANAPLSDGNVVQIGYFDSGFDVYGFSADMIALSDSWNMFSETSIQTIFGQAGRFADNDSTADPTFDGRQIWMWIFKTSDNSGPRPTYDNVTEYGLYTSTAGNWLFPEQGNLFPNNTTSVNSSEVMDMAFGTFDINNLILSPVPEPSLMGLAIVGGGLFFTLRRRRRQVS